MSPSKVIGAILGAMGQSPLEPSHGAAPGLRVRAYRSLEELGPLAERLDALNQASRRPSPFDTVAYLRAFTAHDEFAVPGQEPLLLVAFDGEVPVGFVALRKVPDKLFGLPSPTVRFLVTHDTDRPRVLARPEDERRCAEAFYRHLFERERGWDFLELQEQDAESKLCDPPAELLGNRYYLRHFPNNPNGTIPLAGKTLTQYFAALPRSRRRHFDRCVRKVLRAGETELWSSGDDASLEALFDLYLALEKRSWKAGVGGHVGRHPERLAFFRSLFRPDQAMRLSVHLLVQRGVPVAGVILAESGGRMYGLEEAFDEGYRDLSPGNMMMLLAVRHTVERGCDALDLMGNYAYYKVQWGAQVTETQAVQVYRKWRPAHLKALFGEARRWFSKPVSQRDVPHNLDRGDSGSGGDEADAGAKAGRHESGRFHEPTVPVLPPRDAERARAQAALKALVQSGAKLVRVEDAALRKAMPFDTDREQGTTNKGVHPGRNNGRGGSATRNGSGSAVPAAGAHREEAS